MSWPIPKFTAKVVLPQPNYKYGFIILLVMVLTGVLLSISFGKAISYEQVLLYGMLPAILIWMFFWGLVLHRYEQSVNAALQWDTETVRTKQQWQRWSRKQHRVVGNVILTPEENGINALLGNPGNIPAYPGKARPLYVDLSDLSSRLIFIDKEIEKQCPGYREYLGKIVIPSQTKYQSEMTDEAVYKQWELRPEYSDAVESFCRDDKNEREGLVLFLCIQEWINHSPEKYSEFITAQLITTKNFVAQNTFSVIAGVGRCLSTDSLNEALDTLVEYNQLAKESLCYIWLAGIDADERTQIVQYVISKKWALFEKHPLISINYSFGPSGPLMFPLALSLLTEAAVHTDEMQLLIFKNEEEKYSICLITRKLFT